MNDSRIVGIDQIREFLKNSVAIHFKGVSKKEKYRWIENTMNKFGYLALKKKDKGTVRNYMIQMTGFSLSQMGKLILKKKKFGKIFFSSTKRNTFPIRYASDDISRLIETDNSHSRLSGKATKEIFKREYEKFGKKEYEKLSKISIAHIYNLRKKRQYVSHSLTCHPTRSVTSSIGERRKPDNEGKPGYIRVDSVHQGDLDKKKGVYHINMVDETTQWEIVGCVEKISERYLEVLLEDLISQFPFQILNFHSDNGSEYINKTVAKLLNTLVVRQTKSRSGKCNDNALVECKNGSVIRKHMGKMHVPQKNAKPINVFYKNHFNSYLNYHRPCAYPTMTFEKNGKRKKKYETYMVPYEKLKLLENASRYLKDGITFDMLDEIAYAKSDNEYAAFMQKEKKRLFNNLTE